MLDVLSRIPGVGDASLFAKLNYSMRIRFDTQRLSVASTSYGRFGLVRFLMPFTKLLIRMLIVGYCFGILDGELSLELDDAEAVHLSAGDIAVIHHAKSDCWLPST